MPLLKGFQIYSGHGKKAAAKMTAKRDLAPRGYRYRIVKATKFDRRAGSRWIVMVERGGAKSRRLPRRRR